MISYKGISRAKLLSELYNNAINKNILNDEYRVMSEEDMGIYMNHYDELLGHKNYIYEIIGGRNLWVDLSDVNEFDGQLYDFHNILIDSSVLSAQEVVDKIRLEMEDVKDNKKLIK